MEYQYIEKGIKQLYSVYHQPETTCEYEKEIGVVLCYPFGQEYIRCHRLYVNFAKKLAIQGYHVLRFDYSGTGDSSGEFSSTTIDTCLDDIGLAVNELREACRVSEIILIGLRFGATLSLIYSQKYKVDKLILWNPVMDGAKYLKDINTDYKNWLAGSFAKEKKVENDNLSNFGFLFSSVLTKEIRSISLEKKDFYVNFPLFIINDEEPFDLRDTSNITFEKSVNKEFWVKRDNEKQKSLVPVFEISEILNWINIK